MKKKLIIYDNFYFTIRDYVILKYSLDYIFLKKLKNLYKKNLFFNFFFYNYFINNFKKKNLIYFFNFFFYKNLNFFFVYNLSSFKKQFSYDLNFLKVFFKKNEINFLFLKKSFKKNFFFNNCVFFNTPIDNINITPDFLENFFLFKFKNFEYSKNELIYVNFNLYIFNILEFYKIFIFTFFLKINYKIYIKKFKPENNSKRFRKKISSYYTNNKSLKRLGVGFKSFSGRNFTGKITVRHRNKGLKKLFYNIDYKRTFTKKISICLNLKKLSYINCFIALIKYSNGIFSYVLAAHKLSNGNYLYTTIRPPRFSLRYNINCNILLKFLDLNTIFFNLEVVLKKGGKYSRSAGTFCTLVNLNLDKNTAKITLPTNKRKIVSIYCLITLGRASNIFYKNQFFSKAGFTRNLGIRPSVRGVAMNPIDHPNGGRTKSNSPESTPWGKIAKKNK